MQMLKTISLSELRTTGKLLELIKLAGYNPQGSGIQLTVTKNGKPIVTLDIRSILSK